MNWLRQIVFRLQVVLGKRQRDRVLDEELQTHLALLVEQNVARGMSPEAARREAKLSLGGADQIKESVHDHRGLPLLETFVQDIHFALRMLRKSPGFTAVAVLTLALGIGANTAIFSVLEAQMWKSLPFPDSNRLVNVLRTRTTDPNHASLFSAPDFPDWSASAQNTFDSICAFQWPDFYNMPGADTAERVTAQPVSSTFFDTLRMPPVLGRSFLASEQRDGSNHEVILSYAFWQSHYTSNPRIIGSTLVLDGSPYTIVGVAPAALDFGVFGDNSNMYVPLVIAHRNIGSRTGTGLLVVARLKQEVSFRSAQAQMDVMANQLARQYPERDADTA
ncbi:MAG: ABC transporter permease [Candidatus Acidiferrales bacterium]